MGYWKFRGRGQVIRHLLAYTGLEYEEKSYGQPNEWFGSNGDKGKLGLDFPNLPYLVQGDFRLTESMAIANHVVRVGKREELLGKTGEDRARVEMLLFLLEDLFSLTMNLFFSPNYASDRTRIYDSKVKTKLEELNRFVGEKDFALGYLTLVDFKLAETAHYFEKLYTDHLSSFATLFRIRKNVEGLPEIKRFYEKGGLAGPFLPSYAQLKF